jgi:8-oxo-dGTP pyrophosphatase MutT (NUDIX family)
LIKHHIHQDGREHWVLPGGGREPGESEEECVAREMKEETCLDVRVERLLLKWPVPDAFVYQWFWTYLCTPVGGRAQPGHEPEPGTSEVYAITEVAWFDLRDEATWGPTIPNDAWVYAQMREIRALLGYGPATP